MARRQDHTRDELRELALGAASRLLDEQGFEALSTRRIATEIGYSAGTLYSVFRNLDDLCWQLNGRTLELLLERLEALDEPDPRARLRAFALVYTAFAGQWPQRWSLLFEHRTPDTLDVPTWLDDAIARLFGLVEAGVRELAPEAGDTEIALVARTLWGAVHGITVLQLRGKLFLTQGGSSTPMLNSLVDHYLDGWLASQGAEA